MAHESSGTPVKVKAPCSLVTASYDPPSPVLIEHPMWTRKSGIGRPVTESITVPLAFILLLPGPSSCATTANPANVIVSDQVRTFRDTHFLITAKDSVIVGRA